jgi:hypothetical protein
MVKQKILPIMIFQHSTPVDCLATVAYMLYVHNLSPSNFQHQIQKCPACDLQSLYINMASSKEPSLDCRTLIEHE